MSRPNINKVEIVEPPIGELSKNKSSFKRSCLTGCGCVVFFIIAFLIIIRLILGSGPQTLKTIPDQFPKNIQIYDQDSIETITFIPGRYKERGLAMASIFPKLILSPLLINSAQENAATSSGDVLSTGQKIWQLLALPASDKHDTVRIEWKNMDAEPQFVLSFYQGELQKQGYSVSEPSITNTTKQITFIGPDGTSGTLFVQSNDEAHPGTDYAALTVNLVENKN